MLFPYRLLPFLALVASESYDGAHLAGASSPASLRLPTFVSSHMVLQREPHQARIWGWSAPGSNVTAKLDNEENVFFDIASDSDGSWSINFPPKPAGADHSIRIEAQIDESTEEILLDDIAFGDVFLCSGQSNMELNVDDSFDFVQELEDSVNYPNLRLATVNLTAEDEPMDDVLSKAFYVWARSGVDSVSGYDSNKVRYGVYSAACYFFGRDLYKSMDGQVPIGLVTAAWGGQRIESFSSPDALSDKTCGGTVPEPGNPIFIHDVDAGADHHDDLPPLRLYREEIPSLKVSDMQIWNGMIHPLLPMRFTGAVWYQGEANAYNLVDYACLFPSMIADWRQKFDLPDLSFVYVELAAYREEPRSGVWPWLRAAQGAALELPGVGMATAIDLGDPDAPFGPIHSRRKQEVGRRLALTMKAIQYNDPTAQKLYSGPVLAGVRLNKGTKNSVGATTSFTLSFTPSTRFNLHLEGTAACSSCCSIPPFEVMKADKTWIRVPMAKVISSEEEVLIEIPPSDDLEVYGIRYAWEGQPECALYNGEGGPDDHLGIPAAPFKWCAYPTGEGDWTHNTCGVPTGVVEDEETNAFSRMTHVSVTSYSPLLEQ